MLVYAPFALCFVTFCGVFMHFLKLTYLRDATVTVPCFMLFLYFRKVTLEIFSELDETKAKVPIFPDTRQSPKQRRRGTRGRPHPPMARATPWPHRGLVWASGPPPNIAFRLYILLDEKNLRTRSIF
jgi:hypothetical protein